MSRSTAYDDHPQHTLVFDEEAVSVRVSIGDVPIATSTRALNLREGGYPPVVYLPREDVDLDRLSRSDHTTHCPFKGDAAYFDFVAVGKGEGKEATTPQVAWSYEDPFDQMLAIKGHIAFYPDRARIEILER